MAYATPVYTHPTATQKKVGLSVAAMVLGILAIVFFWVPFAGWIVGVLAIVLGAVAVSQANKKPEEYGGKGMAITGLVLGIIQVSLWLLFFLVFAAFFAAIFG
jgi:hypothetical protein